MKTGSAPLRWIFDASPDPILVTEPGGQIIYVNPAWEKQTGYLLAEVEGLTPNILKSGKTPSGIYKNLWNALSNNQPYISESVVNRKKDGTEYQMHASYFPVIKNGATQYFVQIHHDITKRSIIDEHKKEFLSVASHELKTPLTTLKLLIEAKIKSSLPENIGKVVISPKELEIIDREIDRLTKLIDDILDIARAETGKIHVKFEIINLSTAIENVVKKMRLVAKNNQITFIGEKTLLVVADPDRIEQVLINFLTNAIKYSPGKSLITVGVEKKKHEAVVSVKDTGIGIPKDKIPFIFDRFYQAHVKPTEGFGLGLYISKEIIKKHEGKIWVKSKIGKGSTFYFSLPLVDRRT